jgi:hypothetical protein
VGAVALGHSATPRFPSPLIEPDVRISRIRFSDWLHREAHGKDHSTIAHRSHFTVTALAGALLLVARRRTGLGMRPTLRDRRSSIVHGTGPRRNCLDRACSEFHARCGSLQWPSLYRESRPVAPATARIEALTVAFQPRRKFLCMPRSDFGCRCDLDGLDDLRGKHSFIFLGHAVVIRCTHRPIGAMPPWISTCTNC